MYRVILQYKKQTDFELTIEANSKEEAKRKAELTAKQCGWSDAVKKATVLEA